MSESKITRDLQTRAMDERPKQWAPPELLPEPDKQPGYAYRWIRVSMLNVPDPRNISGKLREGWEPVKISEQPKFKLLVDSTSKFQDGIEIGGLLLCKTPEELVQQRNDYYAQQSKSQTDAVDSNFMRQSDARMPLFNDRKSTSSFGKGS
jgi:hypothetical protein